MKRGKINKKKVSETGEGEIKKKKNRIINDDFLQIKKSKSEKTETRKTRERRKQEGHKERREANVPKI